MPHERAFLVKRLFAKTSLPAAFNPNASGIAETKGARSKLRPRPCAPRDRRMFGMFGHGAGPCWTCGCMREHPPSSNGISSSLNRRTTDRESVWLEEPRLRTTRRHRDVSTEEMRIHTHNGNASLIAACAKLFSDPPETQISG